MKHHSTICRIAYLSLLVACSAAAAGAEAGEPTATAPGCTLFLHGTGTRTGNQDFDQRWITVNRSVANAAIAKLTEIHYRIEPFLSEARTSQEALGSVYKVLQQKNCDQVMQLSHSLTMPSKPGAVPHLDFYVLVFHLESNADNRSVKIISEYEHHYPFDLTKEVLEGLSMSAVGVTIATDVDAAQVLKARGP
jgi:hypothetical protein